jgi:DNA adenine methylase
MQNSESKLYEKGKTLKVEAKPFVKWAGGKTQLLDELASRLPSKIKTIKNY